MMSVSDDLPKQLSLRESYIDTNGGNISYEVKKYGLINEGVRMNGESRVKYCPRCGNSVVVGENFCNHCGAKLEITQQQNSVYEQKSKAQEPTKQGNTNIKQHYDNIKPQKAKKLNEMPTRHVSEQSKSLKNHHGNMWLFFLVVVLGLLFIFKPWIPRGESDPETVMGWCYKNDHNIYTLSAYGALDQGLTQGRDAVQASKQKPNIILLKNTSSKTYVFKVNNHYVYIARIIDFADDSHWEQAVGIAEDKDGKVYHHGLSISEMNSIDSNSTEDTGWNDLQFVRSFNVD